MWEGWENLFALFLLFDLATCRGLRRQRGVCCRWPQARCGRSRLPPSLPPSPPCVQSLHFLSCEMGRATGRLSWKLLCIFFWRKNALCRKEAISPGFRNMHVQIWVSGTKFWTFQAHRFSLDPFSDSGKAKYRPHPARGTWPAPFHCSLSGVQIQQFCRNPLHMQNIMDRKCFWIISFPLLGLRFCRL